MRRRGGDIDSASRAAGGPVSVSHRRGCLPLPLLYASPIRLLSSSMPRPLRLQAAMPTDGAGTGRDAGPTRVGAVDRRRPGLGVARGRTRGNRRSKRWKAQVRTQGSCGPGRGTGPGRDAGQMQVGGRGGPAGKAGRTSREDLLSAPAKRAELRSQSRTPPPGGRAARPRRQDSAIEKGTSRPRRRDLRSEGRTRQAAARGDDTAPHEPGTGPLQPTWPGRRHQGRSRGRDTSPAQRSRTRGPRVTAR